MGRGQEGNAFTLIQRLILAPFFLTSFRGIMDFLWQTPLLGGIMSGYLSLTSSGLEYFEWDRNNPKFDNFKNGFKKGKYLVIDKSSGQVMASFNSDFERDDFWYVKKPMGELLSHLKDELRIPSMVRFGNLVEAVKGLGILLPKTEEEIYGSDGDITIRRQIDTTDDIFTLSHSFPEILPSRESLIRLDDRIDFFGISVKCPMTLTEILEIVFGLPKRDVILEPNGLHYQGVLTDPLDHLYDYCELDEEVTLKHIFELVANHQALKALISIYSTCQHINAYHALARVATEKITDLHYLEISDIAEIWTRKKRTWANLGYPDFHGIGDTVDGNDGYAIEFTPVNEIVNLPIRIKKEFRIIRYGEQVIRPTVLFKGKRKYTLFEILDTIYDEVSFHGTPSKAATFLGDLTEQVRKIKDDLSE